MFPQQPMRRPPGLQRPSRLLTPRNMGMRTGPAAGQQQGLQQLFNPMGTAQQAGARGGGIQGFLSRFLPGGPAASGAPEQDSAEAEQERDLAERGADSAGSKDLQTRLLSQTCSAMCKKCLAWLSK